MLFELGPPDALDLAPFPVLSRGKLTFDPAAAIARESHHIPATLRQTQGQIAEQSSTDDIVGMEIVVKQRHTRAMVHDKHPS